MASFLSLPVCRLLEKEQKGCLGPEVDVLAPGVTQARESEAPRTEENPLGSSWALLLGAAVTGRTSQWPLCAGSGCALGPAPGVLGVMRSLLFKSSVPRTKLGLSVSWDHRVASWESPDGGRRTSFSSRPSSVLTGCVAWAGPRGPWASVQTSSPGGTYRALRTPLGGSADIHCPPPAR